MHHIVLNSETAQEYTECFISTGVRSSQLSSVGCPYNRLLKDNSHQLRENLGYFPSWLSYSSLTEEPQEESCWEQHLS